MRQHLLVLFAISVIATSADAQELIVGGDFAGDVRGSGANFTAWEHRDVGWVVKNFAFGSAGGGTTTFTNEQATVLQNTYNRGLAQVNSITESGTNLTLSFDWTAPAAAVGDSLNVSYQVVAWDVTGTPVDGESRFFNAVNFRSYGVRGLGDSTMTSHATWANFIDGTTGNFHGNATTGFGTFTGTADVLETASIPISLTALGLGNLSDYDFLGVKFNPGTDDSEQVAGGILDNVSLMITAAPNGDFDEDNDVDGADFLKWQRDGLSDQQLLDWQLSYGLDPPSELSAVAVPEPTSLGLVICLAGMTAGNGCRRKRN